jgi:DNA-binding XRE family transcriptional regulator
MEEPGRHKNNCSWFEVKVCGMARVMDRVNEPLVAAFADVLREARLAAGITQEDLAERAEVSVRFISFLETGKRQPSLSALAAISAGLGVTMSVLISRLERRISANH